MNGLKAVYKLKYKSSNNNKNTTSPPNKITQQYQLEKTVPRLSDPQSPTQYF